MEMFDFFKFNTLNAKPQVFEIVHISPLRNAFASVTLNDNQS